MSFSELCFFSYTFYYNWGISKAFSFFNPLVGNLSRASVYFLEVCDARQMSSLHDQSTS